MPSRPVSLIAVICACLGLAFGLAACGGDGDDKGGEVALTDLPSNPENGSSPGSPAGGKVTGSSSGGDAAAEDAGGGSGGGDSEGGEAEGAAGGEEGAGASAGDEEGKAIFTQSCAGCHTLADAGASGSVGPSLDETQLDEAGVAAMVRGGKGGMPSFGGTLEATQIEAVAAYVAAAKKG